MSTEFRCQACNGTFEGTPLKMQFAWPTRCERGNGTYDVCEACAKIFGIEKGKAMPKLLFDTTTIDPHPIENTFFVMPKSAVRVQVTPIIPEPWYKKQYFQHLINKKPECPFPGCTNGEKK